MKMATEMDEREKQIRIDEARKWIQRSRKSSQWYRRELRKYILKLLKPGDDERTIAYNDGVLDVLHILNGAIDEYGEMDD